MSQAQWNQMILPTNSASLPPQSSELMEPASTSGRASDPDLEIGLQDQRHQIEEERHRHLLTDEEYEELLQDLLHGGQPSSPKLSPSIEAITNFDISFLRGTTIPPMPESYSLPWVPPSFVTNQSEEPVEPSIYKVRIRQTPQS